VQHVVGRGSARLDGFTVRGGVTTSPGSVGGGLYNVSASLTVARVEFQANRAETGGAIYNQGSSLLIEDCKFTGNSARISGGAIHSGGELTVESSDFVGNTAQHSDQLNGVGGAIANRYGSALIEDCTFQSNGADYDGGAIHDAGLTTIRNGLFESNSAAAGGAIHTTAPGSGASIEGCTFVGNSVASAWREGCDEFLRCYGGYYGGKGGAIYDFESSRL
jgi:predicted outer membrane repeat protein